MVYLSDRLDFKAGRNYCAAQVSRGQFQAFCSTSPKHTHLVTQSQVLELEGGTRLEDRRQSCEEYLIGENYKRNITPIHSDISRFSRGTIGPVVPMSIRRTPYGPWWKKG
jgi:hypothetical protein